MLRKFIVVMALALACGSASAISLAEEPVVFKSGSWSVLRTVDSMTDKTECTGIYKQDYGIQLAKESLYIKVSGTPEGFRFRFDDDEAGDLHRSGPAQRKLDVIQVDDEDFERLLTAHRLRYSATTVLGHIVEGDLDVTGVAEAVKNISSGCPGEPISGAMPAKAAPSGCSEPAKTRLKAKGMSDADIADACAA